MLSLVTVFFSGGTDNGPKGTSPSRLVYVHGAGNSNSVGTLTVRVHDSADTFVNYAVPHKNYNRSDRIVATGESGARKIAFLRFALPRFAAGELASASVVLTRDAHHMSGAVQLVSAPRNWKAGQLTAIHHPRLGKLLGKVDTDRSMSQVSFDVTDQARPGATLSFGVTSTNRSDTVRFHSREATTGEPTLVLTLRQTPASQPSSAPTSSVPSTSAPSTTSPAPTDSDTAPSGSGQTLVRPSCSVSAILVPSCGRWWGVAPRAYMNLPMNVSIAQVEAEAQQPFDIVHAYHRNGELFPTATERAVALQPGHNRLLFLNWKPATDMTWRQVADGAADARIDAEAAYLKQTWQHPFFLTIWHEPENDVNPATGSGMTAQDYAAMFAHVVNRLRADGVYNAITVMTYMNYLPWEEKPWFNDLYPGDSVVDWIAVDTYASGAASGYKSGDFATMMNRSSKTFPGFYKWDTSQHGNKPLMIGEWGVMQSDSNPNGKANFYNSVAREIQNFPNVHALVYFDMPHPPKPEGNTSFDSSPSALSAFQALRANPAIVAPQVVYGPNGSVTG